MLSFADLDRSIGSVPATVVTTLRRIDTGRGREDLFRHQVPGLLTELAHRARVESITASSALEGVIISDRQRAARIIDGTTPTLRNRSEQEFAGYRAALDYLFASEWRPLNIGLLLHVHGLLFAQTPGGGGQFKTSDNLVVDRSADGTIEVRFVPVPAAQTPFYTAELIERFNDARRRDEHHPLLLIGLFVLDLLTIHPFVDGNGRVVRALTNALLDYAGYGVGRFVSIEQHIASTADSYYESLLDSTRGWHDETNDPWPWLRYFVSVVASAYDAFEQRATTDRPTATKQQQVRDYVLNSASVLFSIGEIRAALPGVSDPTIRLVLERLKNEQVIAVDGTGRAARWRKRPES